jgi:predicted kinase/5-methylcytosine-specific restriction endonuclease McrA
MPHKPQARCTICRRLHDGTGRCPVCDAKAAKPRAGRTVDTARWRRIAGEAKAEHLATHGPICPGWGRPPHQVDPAELTADHIVPRNLRGGDEPSNIGILCQPCNSAKRDRLPAAPAHGTQPAMVLLCGIPASGKTTWARDHADVGVLLDDVVASSLWLRLERERRRRAAALLAAGQTVIVDGCNLDPKQRSEWRRIAHINGARCELVLFDCPLSLALERNSSSTREHPVPAAVVESYAARWIESIEATTTERWDSIAVVTAA